MSHGGRRAKPRRGSSARTAAAVTAVAAGLLVALVAVFLLGRSMADEQRTARRFTGEVASFADDGRVLCVEPHDPDLPTPFCDVYYVGPDTGEIEVGDAVRVRTVDSRGPDGTAIAGILVTVLTD